MIAPRILVVDDNATNAKLLAYLMRDSGYEVDTAPDAEVALGRVHARRPHLILMDVQLPGIDGLELTRRLKSDPITRGIVIVAVTAFSHRTDQQRALAAGCDDYIAKPIDTRALPRIVSGHLARVAAES